MKQFCIRLSYAETDNGDVYLSYGDWKSSHPEDSDTSFEEYLTWLGRQKKPRDTIDGLGRPHIPVGPTHNIIYRLPSKDLLKATLDKEFR